jgi:lipoyl(octanoyl) transferase
VTWHGPGQVVLYPILDLNFHKKDLRWYVGQLEETVIQVLAKYGIQAGRDVEHTGVW